MQSAQPVRVGILGAAHIAHGFVAGVAPSSRVKVVAVASRELAKGQRFAHTFGISKAYGSYRELLADPTVDAVYNPLPNGLHAEWSIRAMDAGKHVLCEKPLAASAADARSMFAAARRNGVVLAEGFPYRSQPHMHKLRELVAGGEIGELQLIQASFGFPLSDRRNVRFDPALAGGAVLDLGTYPVSLVRFLCGSRAVRVSAKAHWDPSGVDQTLVATLEHANGLLAQVSCSFVTGLHRQALIVGTRGAIQTTFPNNPTLDRPVALFIRKSADSNAPYQTIEVPALDGFRAEAEDFAGLIASGGKHWGGTTEEESIDIMMTLEAILRSARADQTVGV